MLNTTINCEKNVIILHLATFLRKFPSAYFLVAGVQILKAFSARAPAGPVYSEEVRGVGLSAVRKRAHKFESVDLCFLQGPLAHPVGLYQPGQQ